MVAILAVIVIVINALERKAKPDPTDVLIADFLSQYNIPGAVIGLSQPGSPVELRAYGLADRQAARQMQTTDRFRLASLSKPVTAAAVQQLLAEHGARSLDTALAEDLPALLTARDGRMTQVSLRHLLQHGAGWDHHADFDPFFLPSADLDDRLGLSFETLQDCRPIAYGMLERPLDADPGTSYGYSNLGYCWLGIWIEEISGLPYGTAVQQLVPEARGLSLAAADVTVTHHGWAQAPQVAAALPAVIAAAGGWVGTVSDFMPVATRPLAPWVFSRPGYAAPDQYYGLGWRVWERPEGRLLTHYGALPGVFSLVVRTESGAAAVALFNGRPAPELEAFGFLFEGLAGLPIFQNRAE
ncbi:serine hydrolase domain-containing protein [Roseobacter weihaiensis]|uniref:serine hydrolase domain-containing protein n=1 Tax=Roseobacter weihaiensis TaxID=2763262 RepID=UPI001D0B3977|nr:serine hydrolase domain-containing protein [Roseobacter sp. H9]